MANEGSTGISGGDSRGKRQSKAKAVVRWVEDSDSEETSELSLCLVGKLWTTRRFNSHAFMNTMEKIWNPRKGMEAKEIETNLFLFQFFHWKDLDRVLEGEPWLFDKNVVVLKLVTSAARPSELAQSLTHAPFWARIYDCPLGGRKEKKVRALAEAIGTTIKIDENCTKCWTKSLRVKVLMDLREPFTDEIALDTENGQVASLPVKYERLPNICYYCGRVGHVEKDCEAKDEDGEGGSTYGFGEWMRASPWKTGKDGVRRAGETSVTGRRLVFKPTPIPSEAQIPTIDQMAESLLSVQVEEVEANRKGERGTSETANGDGEELVEQDAVPLGSGVKTPVMPDKKKGSWHRIKRDSDGEAARNGKDNLFVRKRDIGELEIVAEGTNKRLKQGCEHRGDQANSMAEAAQQPREMP